MTPAPLPRSRPSSAPRINRKDLVLVAVAGRIGDALMRSTPYRIGQDGGLRVVPGTGGIVINHRVGDRCIGRIISSQVRLSATTVAAASAAMPARV